MNDERLASAPGRDDLSSLFRPLSIGKAMLRNRIVMAPMTREFSSNGLLSPGAPDYYARRARGTAGLIITEGTSVDHPVSHHSARVPHFYGDAALEQWRKVVEAVHQAGGLIFPQLWHTGLYRLRQESANPDALNMAPSAVGREPCHAMTESDIADVVNAFARGAAAAKANGFDGVAIHGAHGYLLDQFLWKRTNRRTDGYGGPVANRVRFAVELVRAVRTAVGTGFPILLRFSQWKGTFYGQELASTPSELEAILTPLADAGVDIFDASMRRFWLPEFKGSPLNLAGWAKKLTGKLAMAVGSVGLEGPLDGNRMDVQSRIGVSQDNLGLLAGMLERGDFDLVGLGRVLLANPRWGDRIASGRFDALAPYDPGKTAAQLEPATEGG